MKFQKKTDHPTSAVGIVLTAMALLLPSLAEAHSAKLLPDGVWRMRLHQNIARADNWYDSNGVKQSLGELGRQKLASNGIPVTQSNVYELQNQATYRLSRTDLTLDYGITDNLTLGLWLPWFSQETNQNTSLNQGPAFGLLPTTGQAIVTAAAASLDETDPRQSDWGDLFLGFKQRISGDNHARFRFALGGGVRAPTGHVADPLNPEDLSTGDGQWDLGLWSWTDYQFTENFLVNMRTRHDYGLTGHRFAFIPTSRDQTMQIKFQPAIHHQLQLEPQYRIPNANQELMFGMSFIYDLQGRERRQAFDSQQMRFSGPLTKIDGTGWERFMIKSSLGVRLRQFKTPMTLYISYSHTVSGKNTLDIDGLELRLDLYFKGWGE